MWAWASGVFLFLLLVYLAGLIPTVVDQDSGELVSAAHVLGIAHPTGYPLWVLLGRAFDFFPIGHTSAYRVALLSAVGAAAAAALIVLLAARLTGQALPAAFGGLAFGLWFPTWSQAVRAEVYGLTGLLFALALLASWQWDKERSPPQLYWLSLAAGFVAMHHRTAFLAMAPALALAFWLTRPRRARIFVAALLVFAAPFVCYGYLPIRALARPPVNWTDPATLERFLDHVLGSQYTHFAFSHSVGQMIGEGVKLLPQLLAASAVLSVVLAITGLPLIGWGWGRWYRRQPALAAFLAAGAGLLCFWVLQWGETTDLKVFLLPLGEVLAVCWAVGLAALAAIRGHRQRIARVGMWGLGAGLCLLLLWANWERSDLSNRWGYRDEWAAALRQMEPNAIFVSDFDVPSFATLYLQNVEGLRKDVTLLRTVGVMQEWYVNLIADPELRGVVAESWQQVNAQIPITSTGTREFWDGSALFASLLAHHYRGRRAVYAVHGPTAIDIPSPPDFVGLSEDLVALQFDTRPVVRLLSGSPVAQFPGVGSLMGFQWDRSEAGNGEMVGFAADWQLAGQPRFVQFGIALIPEGMDPKEFGSLPEEQVREQTRLIQAFPLMYGLRELSPSPEGMVYEQRGEMIVPTNAPPGTYRTAMGVTALYSTDYREWIGVGKIEITARPRPRNGP